MAFKMTGFSGFKQKKEPSVGSVVGDIDNRVSDALYDGDLLELGAGIAQVNKDIETVKKAGKGKELEDYITTANYTDVNAFLNSSPFDQKRIKYDEDKSMEYVMHKGKKVYGSWNEFEPNKKNKVKTKGLSDHIIEKDGELFVNEATWDSTLSHNASTDDYDQENKRTRKTEGTKGQQRRRRRRGGFPTR